MQSQYIDFAIQKMIKSNRIKKIVAVAIATTLMSSYSITAFAGEVSPSDLPNDSVVEKIEIDWSSLDEATSHMLEKLTEEEKTAIADIVEGVRTYKEKLEALDENDKATALGYAAIYNAIADIVSENYANDATVKNTFIAAQNIFEKTIDELDNANDYEIFDVLTEKLETIDLEKIGENALAGMLTDEEFAEVLDISKVFDNFSSTFQSAFAGEYSKIMGFLFSNIENNAEIQATIELFKTRYEEILKKDINELSLEDEDAVKAAMADYEDMSTMNKFALSADYTTLLEQNSAIEVLKESMADNENPDVSDSDMPSVDEPIVSDSDIPSDEESTVSDSDIPAVSDSDVEKPSNPSSGNGTVSDSDTIVSDTDTNKGNDSVTDIDTGEAGYMIPSLFTMASSALSYLGVAFKKKKSEELM